MFYHGKNKAKQGKSCGGQIQVDVSSMYRITSPVRLSKGNLKVTSIDLNEKPGSNRKAAPRFFCIHCGEDVEVEDIKVECSSCFEPFNTSEIFTVIGFGALFCKKHLKKLDDTERKGAKSLEEVFEKLKINI